MRSNQFKILDCTVRDGGYINNWSFSTDFVCEMYAASSQAGVDIFEIGFLSNDTSLSIWRQSSDSIVKKVKNSYKNGAQISAMLELETVGMELRDSEETGIDVLRIALNKDKVEQSIDKLKNYKNQGYQVFIQLMGITGYSDIEILNNCKLLNECGYVDYLNIGDSYGSLIPERTKEIISMMKRNTDLKVGLHAHNNMQMGMANVLAAIDSGADIVDGSMYGMGRGGGNVPLELILSYYGKKYPEKYHELPVLEFIDRQMVSLRKEYDWGYSLNNLLSGVYECHPYYTSRLLEKREYTVAQVLKTVKIVSNSDVIGFSEKFLSEIIDNVLLQTSLESNCSLDEYIERHCNEATYSGRHSGRDFLILGNGPTLKDRREEILDFIEERKPIIIGSNNLNGLFTPHYHAFNNQKRFEQYKSGINKNSKLLLGPSIDTDDVYFPFERIICYNSQRSNLDIINHVITSNGRSISILAAAVALDMGARNIYFAGMDGYLASGSKYFYKEDESEEESDLLEKHRENERYLSELIGCSRKFDCNEIKIITPTTYNLSD